MSSVSLTERSTVPLAYFEQRNLLAWRRLTRVVHVHVFLRSHVLWIKESSAMEYLVTDDWIHWNIQSFTWSIVQSWLTIVFKWEKFVFLVHENRRPLPKWGHSVWNEITTNLRNNITPNSKKNIFQIFLIKNLSTVPFRKFSFMTVTRLSVRSWEYPLLNWCLGWSMNAHVY